MRCGKSRPVVLLSGGLWRLLTRVQFANTVAYGATLLGADRSFSLLAGIGFRLALGRGDLIFAAVFGAASTVAIIEAIRGLR